MHAQAWPKAAELLDSCPHWHLEAPPVVSPILWSSDSRLGAADFKSTTSRRTAMRDYKDQNRNERLERAAKAKQQILEKFRARPAADDPAVLARAAERKAIAEAREARDKERAERKAKEAAERAAREAIEKTEREARERREAVAKVIRDAADAAERKAERDRKYAARKARQATKR